MLWKRFSSLALAALFVLTTFNAPARADEGMWTFNNVPRADIKRKYGFDVTDEWLKKVQLGSVRFNSGGSGSFVSADGLVLTNHHVAADTLQKISTAERDYIKTGFYARTRGEEIKSPDIELNVLQSIEDVTARVNGVAKDLTAADANNARRAEISRLEEESTKATGLRSDVVTLYQGGQYNLYRYKKYTDVRLVFAPEFEIAFFGGDPDNFTYPRYCLDMALFRVYENDQPVHIDNYFKWSTNGARANELAFVSGHPGSTQRLNTVAHLEYLRDTGTPLVIKYLERQRALLDKYRSQGTEQARQAQEDFFSIENSLKAYRGQFGGLKDAGLMRRKAQDEKILRAYVEADPQRRREYGDAWEQIGRGRRNLAAYERERRFLESAWGFGGRLFQIARELVRLSAENEKPNGERLPEYTDARRASLELELYSPAPIYADFEILKLTDSLTFMRDELGANNQLVQRVLQGKTPQARAQELVSGTKLLDVEARKQLASGGRAGIESSTDPMIALARSIDQEARAVRKRYEDEVTGVERGAYGKIARALFAKEGTKQYPDATFSLRLSYGAIKGYTSGGRRIPPFTDFAGLYQRAAQHGNKFPYQVPESWSRARRSLNMRTPFNFVTTNDIVGGNSGSPVFNSRAELVGLVFDGNIESLVGNFIYDEAVNRTVAVDSRAMIEALRKIYNANELADELTK